MVEERQLNNYSYQTLRLKNNRENQGIKTAQKKQATKASSGELRLVTPRVLETELINDEHQMIDGRP